MTIEDQATDTAVITASPSGSGRVELVDDLPRRQWTDATGALNRRYVTVSDENGCWQWNGPVPGRCSGPTAALPGVVMVDLGEHGRRQRIVAVRKWLWERAGREVPDGLIVAAGCGDRQCVALDHAELRSPRRRVSDEAGSELVARRPVERTDEAARRLGVTPPTILRILRERGVVTTTVAPPRRPPSRQLRQIEVPKINTLKSHEPHRGQNVIRFCPACHYVMVPDQLTCPACGQVRLVTVT